MIKPTKVPRIKMINPTGDWLLKHGYWGFGVRSEPLYWVYTIMKETSRLQVNVLKEAYKKCKTDREKRSLVYAAILEADSEVESDS